MLYGIISVGRICFEAWKVLGLDVGGWRCRREATG